MHIEIFEYYKSCIGIVAS